MPQPAPQIIPSVPGMFHTVKKGETLWRISQDYQVDLSALADFNKINNICKLEVGQKIYIPDELRRNTPRKNAETSSRVDFIWPYRGQIISCFNQKKLNVNNLGVDILAKPGAAIKAASSGNVIFSSDNLRGYGKTIIIEHSKTFSTVYTNQEENLVKAGDYVTQGQTIAYAGQTGRSVECILHFELRKNNKPQNPLLYLP